MAMAWGLCVSAWADVTLPSLFSDHAVLQKAAAVPVWGKADPGEKVTVGLGDARAQTQAGTDGKWRVNLDLHDKAAGPYELTVESKNRVIVKDVVVGEVWVCSGQSNMDFALKNTDNAQQDRAAADKPMIRHFLVTKAASAQPMDTMIGKWEVCTPASSGEFTAVGYFFARRLNKDLGIPVGLINSAWGATVAEAWTSPAALASHPELKITTEKLLAEEATLPQRLAGYTKDYAAWESRYRRQDRPPEDAGPFTAPATEAADWKKVNLPGSLEKEGFPGPGAVWVQRKVVLPPGIPAYHLYFDSGPISGFDALYWDGVKIAETSFNTPGANDPRRYLIAAKYITPGEHTLALRIFSPAGPPAIGGLPSPLRVGNVSCTGEWLAKYESELPALPAQAAAELPVPPARLAPLQHLPGHLFNAMINPLIPYGIRGVIWYQGESNVGRAWQYRSTFPLLIADWRAHWGQGDFPFYFCQLANFMSKSKKPGDSAWAELREAQTNTLDVPGTGEAVLIDIGEEADIHPRNKKDAGERLALLALANTYGRNVQASGPRFQSCEIESGKARIRFTQAEGGLVARPLPETYAPRSLDSKSIIPLARNSPQSELQGFAICGKDRQWKWADAKIEGDHVVVWSPEVPEPIAVRYAWADNPTCNLYNQAGLPAGPFRTDKFSAITAGNKF